MSSNFLPSRETFCIGKLLKEINTLKNALKESTNTIACDNVRVMEREMLTTLDFSLKMADRLGDIREKLRCQILIFLKRESKATFRGNKFELFCCELISKLSNVVEKDSFDVHHRGGSNDNGIDIGLLCKSQNSTDKQKMLAAIQCKAYSDTIGHELLVTFYGSILSESFHDGAKPKGIFITTSNFSMPALQFVESKVNEVEIELWDIEVILDKAIPYATELCVFMEEVDRSYVQQRNWNDFSGNKVNAFKMHLLERNNFASHKSPMYFNVITDTLPPSVPRFDSAPLNDLRPVDRAIISDQINHKRKKTTTMISKLPILHSSFNDIHSRATENTTNCEALYNHINSECELNKENDALMNNCIDVEFSIVRTKNGSNDDDIIEEGMAINHSNFVPEMKMEQRLVGKTNISIDVPHTPRPQKNISASSISIRHKHESSEEVPFLKTSDSESPNSYDNDTVWSPRNHRNISKPLPKSPYCVKEISGGSPDLEECYTPEGEEDTVDFYTDDDDPEPHSFKSPTEAKQLFKRPLQFKAVTNNEYDSCISTFKGEEKSERQTSFICKEISNFQSADSNFGDQNENGRKKNSDNSNCPREGKHQFWSIEEDEALKKGVKKYPKISRWSWKTMKNDPELKDALQNRSNLQLKDRFFILSRSGNL